MHGHLLGSACAQDSKISKNSLLARQGLLLGHRIPLVTLLNHRVRESLPGRGSKRNCGFHIQFIFVTLSFFRESCGQVFLCCSLCALIAHGIRLSRKSFYRNMSKNQLRVTNEYMSVRSKAPNTQHRQLVHYPSRFSMISPESNTL